MLQNAGRGEPLPYGADRAKRLFCNTPFASRAPAGIRLHLLSLAGDGEAARADLARILFRPSLFTPGSFFGSAPAGIRTPDTLLKRQVLCLLSYWGVAGMAGLEPTISESKSGVLPLHYIPM